MPKRRNYATTLLTLSAASTLLVACGGAPSEDQYPPASTSTKTSVAVEGGVQDGSATADPTAKAASPTQCAPLPSPFTKINACNAIEVTTAALTTMYSTNPTTDKSSQDAVLRAVPLLSSSLIARIAAPASGDAAQGNAEWNALKTKRQKVIATVTVHKQDQSAYYQIARKAVPVNADNTTPGQRLDPITASPAITQVPGMGFRVDSINPLS